jgi:hypothetical protein
MLAIKADLFPMQQWPIHISNGDGLCEVETDVLCVI